jgi:hypothetical protein
MSVVSKRSSAWSLPLTRPLGLPDGTRFDALSDVRDFSLKRLPDERKTWRTWQQVQSELLAASKSGDATDVTVALELVLMLEGALARPATTTTR